MASGLEGTSPFHMLVDDDEDELEEVVHKEGSAASLFGNCGLISVLFETPSGFAIFAYDAVKLTKPDALKHIWADFVNLPKGVFWMKAFKTFEGCAINKDYVSPELSLMIQKYVVNEQTLAVGNDDYKNVIEKCLEIRCLCSPVVQELMWGLRIQLWRFLRPGENSGMTNDDRFPMSEGMIFLLKSHGLDINPHMMVTKQTIELAHVVYECDRCVNKYDSFLRLAAQHLVKISRIYTHRWDLLKLATAFKMIFDPQVEIPDAQRLFSERQLKRLMKHAPRYKNKISKDRCLKAYKEIYSARKRRLKAAKVLLNLVKQAEKTYEDEQAGRAASDPEISRDTKKICRGLGPVMIDELTECHTIVSEKCKKIQVPPTLSTVDALERYTQIFSHPLNMTNRPGILPVDTHPSKIIRIWQGSEDENYSCVYPLKDHTAEVEAVTVHASQKYFVTTASQKYFVTTSRDNSWRFYDISTGSCLAQAGEPSGQEGYTSAVFHPGGRILGTGTTDGAVKIWDVKSQGHKHERTPYQSMLCHSLKMSAGLDVVKIGIFGHAGKELTRL